MTDREQRIQRLQTAAVSLDKLLEETDDALDRSAIEATIELVTGKVRALKNAADEEEGDD